MAARLQQARLAIGDSRPDDHHAIVTTAVAEAAADPSFPADQPATEAAGKLRDAAFAASLRAGQVLAVLRSSAPGERGTGRDIGARLSRWFVVYGTVSVLVAGTAVLVAATALAVAGSPLAWVFGCAGLSFAVGLLTARRSDQDGLIPGFGTALVVALGPFDWGALVTAGVTVRAGLRTVVFLRGGLTDRVATAAVVLVGAGLLVTGHARPGPVPVLLLAAIEILRHRERSVAALLLRVGAELVTIGLGVVVAVAIETSVRAAVDDTWLVVMTVGGGLIWSAGMALCGGPFRPAGWAVAAVAVTSLAARADAGLVPAWGATTLAVAWGLAAAGLLLKTGEPVAVLPPRRTDPPEVQALPAVGPVPHVA